MEARDEVDAVLPFMCEEAGAEMRETWQAPDEEAGEETSTTRQLNFYSWGDFCKSVRTGGVEVTVVIDFPYADSNSPGGLNLKGDDRQLERMYVFKDVIQGDDTRVVLHVHTPIRWGDRGDVTLQERVKNVSSVNVRHAVRGAERFEQEQGNLKMPLVPVSPLLETGWREMWRDGSFARKCTWLWGKAESMPTVEDKRVAARNYDQVRFATRTLHPKLQTPNQKTKPPKPQTPNPQTQNPNPQPQSPVSKPQTPNPKLQTPHP